MRGRLYRHVVIRYSETPPVASSRTRTGQEYDSIIGAPPSSHPRVIRFGTFELILESGELRRDGVKIKLQEQPFQLLSVLLEKAGDVVTREQLQQRLWPADTFVDFDHSLNAAVRKLRTALGDSAEAPRFIETLAKRGYRFIAPVDSREAETAAEAEVSGPRPGRASGGETRPIRWIVAIAVAVGLIAVGSWIVLRQRRTPAPERAAIRSVAVLPFENLSGNRDNDYLSDAMSEEVINALAALPALKVVARTSSSAFKGQKIDVREVGRKLGVASVVEGSVQKSGNRIRVSAELVNVADGFNLWSARFDRQLTDVFAIQDEIARAVATALKARLGGGSRLVDPPTADLEAYALYIKGRDSASVWTRERFDQAIVYYRAALDRDPQFAEAWAGLADLYSVMDHRVGLTSLRPSESYRLALEAAQKALALDPDLADAHAAMGHIQSHLGDFPEARKHLQRAVELNPNSGIARIWYGNMLRLDHRVREAKEQCARAREVDPMSALVSQICSINLWLMGEYEQSLDTALGGIAVHPGVGELHLYAARDYASMGKHTEAAAEIDRAAAASDKATFTEEERALVLALAGRQKEAAEQLARIERDKPRPQPAAMMRAYAAIGDSNAAARWLDRLVTENPDYARLGLDLPPHPAFASFRADARYLAAKKRLGLPGG